MKTLQQIREEKDKLMAEVEPLTTREITPEEAVTYDEKMAKVKELDGQIKTLSRREQYNSFNGSKTYLPGAPAGIVSSGKKADPNAAFRAWWYKGHFSSELALSQRECFEACDKYGIHPSQEKLSLRELSERSIDSGSSPVSDYLVTNMSAAYEKKLKYFFPILNICKVFNTADGNPFDYPRSDATAMAYFAVDEGEKRDDDDGDPSSLSQVVDPDGDKVTFYSRDRSTGVITLTERAVQNSTVDSMGIVTDGAAEAQGRMMEAECVSNNAGTGTDPDDDVEGLLHGLSAGVNLDSGNVLKWQKFVDLEESLDLAVQGLPSVSYLISQNLWANARKIADDENRPVFLNNIAGLGTTRVINEYPVYRSNAITSLASAGDNTVHGVFGAFEKYAIRQVGSPTMIRFNELYRRKRKIGVMWEFTYDARILGHSGWAKTLNAYNTP